MSDAAIYFHSDGYVPQRDQLGGRQMAGQGFLAGFLRTHAGGDIACYPDSGEHFPAFEKFVADTLGAEATARIRRVSHVVDPALREAGTLYVPGPSRMSPLAWRRRRVDMRAFSLCGVTHSIAAPWMHDALGELLTAPLAPWDALVCTSNAVRSAVTSVFDSYETYLRERTGGTGIARPALPVIPLGVEVGPRNPERQENAAARRRWRGELGIADDDVALLFVGRLSLHEKANPAPFFLALRRALTPASPPLHLILAGWFPAPAVENAFRAAARALCPEVRLHVVDARAAETGASIWYAGDIFCSLSDTLQETFGLTPVEAMASSLPVVVADWNGYRDTVTHGVTGFRIPTWTPPDGAGAAIAQASEDGRLNESQFYAVTSLTTSFDIRRCGEALELLISRPEIRQRLGRQALLHARQYDWANVLTLYRATWAELDKQRLAAAETPGRRHPLRDDPFHVFAGYPTLRLSSQTRVKLSPDWEELKAKLSDLQAAMYFSQLLSFAGLGERIIEELKVGPRSAQELIAATASADAAHFFRLLGWLTKFGVVTRHEEEAKPADAAKDGGAAAG